MGFEFDIQIDTEDPAMAEFAHGMSETIRAMVMERMMQMREGGDDRNDRGERSMRRGKDKAERNSERNERKKKDRKKEGRDSKRD